MGNTVTEKATRSIPEEDETKKNMAREAKGLDLRRVWLILNLI